MSSLLNINFANTTASKVNAMPTNNAVSFAEELSFQAGNEEKKKRLIRPKEDTLMENTFINRTLVKFDKATSLPLVHYPRGLGGAPDYTFFEFLQTAKLPYFVGGPVLAALFCAGIKKDNFKSAQAATNVAKHMALGVGLYYLGAALAKGIVNKTIKLTRGVDLNHPYAKAVSTSTSNTGVFRKDVEYHKVFESADFTRWDLLYNKDGKNTEEINKTYADFAKKYKVKDGTKDVDATVKPLIKKTVIMARAWQYALTAFFVTLGIGLANQPAWEKSSLEGFRSTFSQGVFGKGYNAKQRWEIAKDALSDYIGKPFKDSFKQLWKGQSKASSIAGKASIVATAAATLTAIALLIGKTSARNHKIESPKKRAGNGGVEK